jgi:hypothetical protein
MTTSPTTAQKASKRCRDTRSTKLERGIVTTRGYRRPCLASSRRHRSRSERRALHPPQAARPRARPQDRRVLRRSEDPDVREALIDLEESLHAQAVVLGELRERELRGESRRSAMHAPQRPSSSSSGTVLRCVPTIDGLFGPGRSYYDWFGNVVTAQLPFVSPAPPDPSWRHERRFLPLVGAAAAQARAPTQQPPHSMT